MGWIMLVSFSVSSVSTRALSLGILGLAMQNAMAGAIAESYLVTQVNLTANDLVYNSASKEYLASVGSTAGLGLGNSVTRISSGGQILQSTFVGSEPGVIALSSDGSTGYVALTGSPSVRQFNAVTGEAGIQFALGSSWYGPLYAEDMAVVPGQNDSLAVALRKPCCSPRHEGVAIYKNGTQLPVSTSYAQSNSITFGNATTLYGHNNETSEFGLRSLNVDASGVSIGSFYSNALYGYDQTITYDSGLIFSSRGNVIDATSGLLLGTFNLGPYGSLFAPAAKWGQAYALSTYGILTVFDLNTFTPITTYNVGMSNVGIVKDMKELIVTDNGDLAVRTANRIFLLSAVPEPSTYLMWGLGFSLLVAGVRKRRQST